MVAEQKTFLLCPRPLLIAVTALSLTAVLAVLLPAQAVELPRCSQPAINSNPAISYGGSDHLIVWLDVRPPGIYGTRVSASAAVLDPAGIPIGGTTWDLTHANVAFDGTNYLVVWVQQTGPGSYAICGRRVSTGGAIVDSDSTVISTSANPWLPPTVAFDGMSYLVVWTDSRSGPVTDVYGARVTKSGAVLDPGGIAISTASGYQWHPYLAFDGTNYLVVWADNRSGFADVYGARVTTGGVVLDADGLGISTATHLESPSGVAFDGTNYLVVWQDNRNGPDNTYGARVSKGGVVLDPGGIAISTAGEQAGARVAFDGTNYFVVWMDSPNSESHTDIYGARVSTGGVVLDPSGIVISDAEGNQVSPAISFGGMNYLVVWEEERNETYHEIYATRITKDGVVLDPSGFTGLLFASASATAQGGYVTISWQMGVEVSASSFSVQRSESPTGEFLALDLTISQGSGSSFSCTDHSVLSGKTYWYKIVLAGSSGEESYGPIEVHVDAVPTAYAAYQSYPNPFNPVCTIRYDVPRAGRVNLQLFNVSGSLVRTLVDGWREPGSYSEIWDGKDASGAQLPSGVYFYSIKSGDFVATRKMVLIH